VEDVASEGVVLSNGVPPADELVAELDIDGEMVATDGAMEGEGEVGGQVRLGGGERGGESVG